MKKKEESKLELAPAPAAPPALGDQVLFTKSIASQSGSTTRSFLAIVIGFPPESSNFQAKDMAVDLLVLGQPGVLIDGKQGVMRADSPTPGRWSPKK